MKHCRFVVFLLYRYFERSSSKSIAYESSLVVMTVFISLNFLAISTLLGLDVGRIAFNDDGDKIIQYLKSAIYMAPIYFLFTLLFKRKEIVGLEYDERKMKRGYYFLVLYGFLTLLLLVVSAFREQILYMISLHH